MAYQHGWIADGRRFKYGLWARQVGKSFVAALECVLDALATGEDWLLLSRGQRQSNELMRKVRDHLKVMRIACDYSRAIEPTKDTREEVELPNGARIFALPANPDTARGYTANVVLDEFAIHQNADDIWAAVFPSVTRRKLKIRILTTPKGKQNLAYRIWSDQDRPFTRHRTTIHDAVAGGLDVDVEELRSGVGDEETWRQEYLCEFVDEATAFLTFDLIAACETDATPAGDQVVIASGPTWLGVDVGRKRDLTVFWLLQQVGDVHWTRRLVTLKGARFAEQEATLDEIMRACKVTRCCIDATGLGMQLAERAVERHGSYRVEGVTFTNQVKADLAGPVRMRFEDRTVRIPADTAVRSDLHSVRKVTTAAGNIRFDAERSDDGHADRFWSLALALHAAGDKNRFRITVI